MVSHFFHRIIHNRDNFLRDTLIMLIYRYFLIVVFLVFPLASSPSWGNPVSQKTEQSVRVMVSILPQEFFVKRIGGSRVHVETLVQPGQSPATYAPAPRQMTALAASAIYFRTGVPFENALIPKLTRATPDLAVVDLRQDIELLPLEESEKDHGDHHHGDLDPHIWLDPMLALQQSGVIRDTLIQYDPAGAKEYSANFLLLADELRQLDEELRITLSPYTGRSIYVFHPAYGYFCRAYGLVQKGINPDGKEPGARYLARLIEDAGADNTRVIFIQPQFSDRAARAIAKSIGGTVVTLDPLARDYLENMRAIAGEIASALQHQSRKQNKEKP